MSSVQKLLASLGLGIALSVGVLGVPAATTTDVPAVEVEAETALADGVWKNPKTGAVWVIYEGALYRIG